MNLVDDKVSDVSAPDDITELFLTPLDFNGGLSPLDDIIKLLLTPLDFNKNPDVD